MVQLWGGKSPRSVELQHIPPPFQSKGGPGREEISSSDAVLLLFFFSLNPYVASVDAYKLQIQRERIVAMVPLNCWLIAGLL